MGPCEAFIRFISQAAKRFIDGYTIYLFFLHDRNCLIVYNDDTSILLYYVAFRSVTRFVNTLFAAEKARGGALRAVRACAQTMREKSARARGALRLLSPLAESLLKEAEELCAQTGAGAEEDAVPAAANYAACKRAMEEAAARAFFALDGLAGRYPRAQRAQVRALALCFFCARL